MSIYFSIVQNRFDRKLIFFDQTESAELFNWMHWIHANSSIILDFGHFGRHFVWPNNIIFRSKRVKNENSIRNEIFYQFRIVFRSKCLFIWIEVKTYSFRSVRISENQWEYFRETISERSEVVTKSCKRHVDDQFWRHLIISFIQLIIFFS